MTDQLVHTSIYLRRPVLDQLDAEVEKLKAQAPDLAPTITRSTVIREAVTRLLETHEA
jgi:hypothetical protein